MINLGDRPRLILEGDARARLAELPSDSVDCVVTSPPYFQLRNYGVPGQIGLEKTWREHLARILEVTAEVKRVLKPTGSLWLNYGDTTAGKGMGAGADLAASSPKQATNRGSMEANPSDAVGSPWLRDPTEPHAKHLLGLPFRLRFALNDEQGWISRSDIVWWRRATMPLSMKDRVTPKHEMLFHLVKRPRYFFDLDAIRTPFRQAGRVNARGFRDAGLLPGTMLGSGDSPNAGRARLDNTWEARRGQGRPKGTAEGQKPDSVARPYKPFNVRERDVERGVALEKWGPDGHAGRLVDASEDDKTARDVARHEEGWNANALLGANPGNVWPDLPEDVWDVPPEPFAGAHFATFPSELPRRCILASCPERVCVVCGAPWRRTYSEPVLVGVRGRPRAESDRVGGDAYGGEGLVGTGSAVRQAKGWAPPSCGHGEGHRPGVVLDPFAGAGTTLLAAAREGRAWVGIELNPRYVAEIIRPRLAPFAAPLTTFQEKEVAESA